jgi:hypothetical protein
LQLAVAAATVSKAVFHSEALLAAAAKAFSIAEGFHDKHVGSLAAIFYLVWGRLVRSTTKSRTPNGR